MKVQIKIQPSGHYNGAPWPGVGEIIDLPEIVAEGMLASGTVVLPSEREQPADKEQAKAEVATAPAAGVETAMVKTAPKKK